MRKKSGSKSIFQRYRILPLALCGLVVAAILTLAALLLWTLISYYSKVAPAETTVLPYLVYLGTIFIAALFITWLIRGGTVFPALAVGLVAAVLTLLLAPEGTVHVFPAILKCLVSMLAAALGFAIMKLFGRKKPQQTRSRRSESPRERNRYRELPENWPLGDDDAAEE